LAITHGPTPWREVEGDPLDLSDHWIYRETRCRGRLGLAAIEGEEGEGQGHKCEEDSAGAHGNRRLVIKGRGALVIAPGFQSP
jgi:hypothetical protein